MRKMGYVTLQREIEKRLKANNKAREALGMELKKPIVAFSNDVVYITDNFSMFFVIPQGEYILPYKPNIDEYRLSHKIRSRGERDATDLKNPKRDLSRYCAYLKDNNGKIKDTVKVYFIKELLQRFYKDTNKLELLNDGTKHGVTHVYRNNTLVGVLAPFMKDWGVKMLVENSFGKLFDFYLALHYMDDEICGEIDFENSPCSEQEFFDIYCLKHFQKFGETFEFDKRNPII